MVRQQFAKLRPRKGSCGFESHILRHKQIRYFKVTYLLMKMRVEFEGCCQSIDSCYREKPPQRADFLYFLLRKT